MNSCSGDNTERTSREHGHGRGSKTLDAKRKAALVTEIIQGKTTVAEASRAFDMPPSEIEEWVDEAKRGMENALRAKPLDVRE